MVGGPQNPSGHGSKKHDKTKLFYKDRNKKQYCKMFAKLQTWLNEILATF